MDVLSDMTPDGRPIFYLAHTFGERYHVRDVLIPKIESLGIKVINPFFEENGQWREGQVDLKIVEKNGKLMPDVEDEATRRLAQIGDIGKTIVETDLNTMFFDCDGVIAYMPDTSAGTISEIWSQGFVNWLSKRVNDGRIKRLSERPVFLITQSERNLHHVWLLYACRKVFKDEEELISYLRDELPNIVGEINGRKNL